MPFRSKAQRRLFYAKKDRGEMSQDKIDEWEEETPAKIPERVGKAGKKKPVPPAPKKK